MLAKNRSATQPAPTTQTSTLNNQNVRVNIVRPVPPPPTAPAKAKTLAPPKAASPTGTQPSSQSDNKNDPFKTITIGSVRLSSDELRKMVEQKKADGKLDFIHKDDRLTSFFYDGQTQVNNALIAFRALSSDLVKLSDNKTDALDVTGKVTSFWTAGISALFTETAKVIYSKYKVSKMQKTTQLIGNTTKSDKFIEKAFYLLTKCYAEAIKEWEFTHDNGVGIGFEFVADRILATLLYANDNITRQTSVDDLAVILFNCVAHEPINKDIFKITNTSISTKKGSTHSGWTLEGVFRRSPVVDEKGHPVFNGKVICNRSEKYLPRILRDAKETAELQQLERTLNPPKQTSPSSATLPAANKNKNSLMPSAQSPVSNVAMQPTATTVSKHQNISTILVAAKKDNTTPAATAATHLNPAAQFMSEHRHRPISRMESHPLAVPTSSSNNKPNDTKTSPSIVQQGIQRFSVASNSTTARPPTAAIKSGAGIPAAMFGSTPAKSNANNNSAAASKTTLTTKPLDVQRRVVDRPAATLTKPLTRVLVY